MGSCLSKILLNMFFCAPQCSSMAQAQKTIRQKHNGKEIADQVSCKHTSFWALSLIIWSHSHLIENGHLLCIRHNFRSRLCTPTAAYNIMWICNVPSAFPSDFPLTCPVSSPCHNLAIALPPVLLLLSPAMQVCPFVATSVAKGFCSQPKFCHWICSPCYYPRHVFARVFFATDVAITFAPVVFFSIHIALQIATAIAIAIAFALEVALVVAIKFGRLIEHCYWFLGNIYIYVIY